jgi:hypothetical protein
MICKNAAVSYVVATPAYFASAQSFDTFMKHDMRTAEFNITAVKNGSCASCTGGFEEAILSYLKLNSSN